MYDEEPEITEATEPEATEPEATEPEATEPEATEPEAKVGKFVGVDPEYQNYSELKFAPLEP